MMFQIFLNAVRCQLDLRRHSLSGPRKQAPFSGCNHLAAGTRFRYVMAQPLNRLGNNQRHRDFVWPTSAEKKNSGKSLDSPIHQTYLKAELALLFDEC